jgi:hypothetical protein
MASGYWVIQYPAQNSFLVDIMCLTLRYVSSSNICAVGTDYIQRACRSFILNLNILRSPSLITVQVQCKYLSQPSQVFSIIQDFGIQAQFLLQEIHGQVETFLKEKEKQKAWFPREAFNLGLVWGELNNFMTIPDDWRCLGGLVSSYLYNHFPSLRREI